MSSDSEYSSEDETMDWMGRVAEGTHAAHRMQTRFTRIPREYLNKETVAGIRDMYLGKVKNGQPVGAPTIRFDTGMNTGRDPHINVDPLGHPSAQNPHWEVPSGVIKGAEVVNKTLRYAGITLTVAAVVIDTWRVGSALKEDLYIKVHADEIIKELKQSIRKLNKKLEKTDSESRRRDIKSTIEHLESVLRDVKRTKKVPVKLLKTTSSVGGGWGGSLAGAWAGSWAGAQAGALVGVVFGPVGAAIWTPVGALVGAIGGGIGGGYYGSKVGEAAADLCLELADSD